jgi:hypothetical protein
VSLARAFGVAPALARQLDHRGFVEVGLVAEVTGDGAVEVDVRVLRVVDPVRRSRGQQFADELGDLPHRLHGADVVPRGQHPQRLHVLAEERRLAHAEHDPVVMVAGSALQ